MRIDWHATQDRLARRGLYPGRNDGLPGPLSYAGALALASGRKPTDPVVVLRATVLAERAEFYGLGDALCLAELLAQVTNETGDFSRLRENLNYTKATTLVATWPTRFRTVTDALPYLRQPVKLANYVYDRPKEGNTRPGDGWLFRGAFDIQLTFANNFRAADASLGTRLYDQPDASSEPGTSLLVALDYWRRAGVNRWAEQGAWQQARSVTNTGRPDTPPARIIGLAAVAQRRAPLLGLLKP